MISKFSVCPSNSKNLELFVVKKFRAVRSQAKTKRNDIGCIPFAWRTWMTISEKKLAECRTSRELPTPIEDSATVSNEWCRFNSVRKSKYQRLNLDSDFAAARRTDDLKSSPSKLSPMLCQEAFSQLNIWPLLILCRIQHQLHLHSANYSLSLSVAERLHLDRTGPHKWWRHLDSSF